MRTPIRPAAVTHKLRGSALSEAELHLTRRENIEVAPLPPYSNLAFPRVRGYEILSIIGSGGMGIVYEARHCELNRRVAIKTLRGEALADPEFRTRFRAEAEAIAKLQHPNIIQVFEVGAVEPHAGEPSPAQYIALEYVDGGSLSQWTRAPQAPREAARMVEALARAAHAAHQLGIVHRDLKPANVLLTRDGVPKIADFGIAKQVEPARAGADQAVTCDGIVLGTPEYMAPEQFHQRTATPTIDVYALGVILYQLFTARVPFQGSSFAETMFRASREEPVPPSRFQPGIPRDLETICLKCLEKTPGKRYDSAEALADDLARWATGQTIRARAIGPAERTLRWGRRNPAVAVLSAAVLLVAVAGLTGIVWGWNEARASERTAQENAGRAATEAANAREAVQNERWERYRVSVMAASGALRLHDSNAARGALEDAPGEYRDWVWHLLSAQLDRSQYILKGRGNETELAQFTPDGRWAVLHGRDNTSRVWDLVTRREFAAIDIEPNPRSETVSNDGSMIAYATNKHAIVVCDVATGKTRTVFRGHTEELDSLWFTPDGSRLISTSADHTARVWDLATGKQLSVFRGPKETARPLLMSPDLRFAVARWDGAISPRIWEMSTGREVVLKTKEDERVLSTLFSPKGDRLVTVDMYPSNAVRLWDVASGKLLATMRGHENQVNHFEFSADGTRLVTASLDRTVRVWDVSAKPAGRATGPLLTLKGHTGGVNHAAFSADGRRVVSCAHDRTVRYWDTATGDEIAVLNGHTDDVRRAVVRADGSFISSASADGTIRLWDLNEVERGYAILGHEKFVYSAAFHRDGLRVASSAWDGTARIWDATTGKQLAKFDHKKVDVVAAVALHPNGRLMATLGRKDGVPAADAINGVRLWDIETQKELHVWSIPNQDWHDGRIAFSPNGDLLAAGCADNRVRIWDVNTWREVATLEGHTASIRDVAFSPDGRWLASGGDHGDATVRVWDLTGKEPPRVLRTHKDCVYALAWNRTGTLLASGSIDGNVLLWDTRTWGTPAPLRQGTRVHGVAFSPNGELLTVACADNLIRVWSVAKQQEVAELSGHKNYIHFLAFSPDGSRLISASGDRTLRVWDALPRAERAHR